MGMSSIETCCALTLWTITTAQIHVQRQDNLVGVVTQDYRLDVRRNHGYTLGTDN